MLLPSRPSEWNAFPNWPSETDAKYLRLLFFVDRYIYDFWSVINVTIAILGDLPFDLLCAAVKAATVCLEESALKEGESP